MTEDEEQVKSHRCWTTTDMLLATHIAAIGGYFLAHIVSAWAAGRIP